MNLLIYLFCLGFCVSLTKSLRCVEDENSSDLLPFLDFCRRESLDFEKCWISAMENIRPYLKDGSRMYDIRSVEEVPIDEEFTERVSQVTVKTSDFVVYGLSDYFIRSVNLDNINKPVIEIHVPKIRLHGNYSMSGSILQFPIIPVSGSGHISVNLTDCSYKAVLHTRIYKKNGRRKVKFTKADLRMKVDNGRIMLEDIKRGDRNYLGPINYLLNDHFKQFTEQLIQPIEETSKNLLLDVGNAIARSFTYDELFNEDSDERYDSSERYVNGRKRN